MPMNWTSPQRIFLGITLATVLTQPLHAETLNVCIEGGCDFSAIQPAIDAAADGDVIEISAGTYLIDQTIDTNGKAVTIHGSIDPLNGELLTILDGQGTHRVLTCISGEGPDTVFEHLVVQNGYVDGYGAANQHGGGMYNIGSSPTLTNCTFSDNYAESRGGGIYNEQSSPTLTHCTFSNNSTSGNGGGMYNDSSSPTLTNCTFTSNTTLVDCDTEDCSYRLGGGMYNRSSSSPTLTNCTFTNNSAAFGGGVLCDSFSEININNCSFTENLAENSGGGVYIFSAGVTVTDCTFTENTAFWGGGVVIYSDESTLTECTFTNNSANRGGGGTVLGDSTLTDCSFMSNSAETAGGGLYSYFDASPTLTNCTFTNNSTDGSGGALYCDEDSSPTIHSTSFCQNGSNQIEGPWTNLGLNCITDSCGDCAPSLITVCSSGCDFTELAPAIESATPNDTIDLAAGTYLLDQAIDFHGLPATLRGAVDPSTGTPLTILDGQGTHQVLTVTSNESFDTRFENLRIRNGYADQGGGLFIDGTGPTLSNCWFESNAAVRGGGAFVLSGTPAFTDCRIASNTADNGGGFYARSSVASFTRCEFASNLASVRGGGLYTRSEGSELTLIDCQVIDNQSGLDGGGGYVSGNRFDAVNTLFRGNQAEGDGGGIRLLSIEDFALSGCMLEANTGHFGGGAFIGNSDGHFTDCVIQGNSASLEGGGLAIDNSTVALVQTSVCANSSDQVAGTVELDEASCVQAVCEDCASEPACPGDLDGDGDVGASDLTQLLADWGCLGADCDGDVNNDGLVDGADLTVILSRWGACSD